MRSLRFALLVVVMVMGAAAPVAADHPAHAGRTVLMEFGPSGEPERVEVAPDGARAVVLVREPARGANARSLYSVPLGAGAAPPVRLHPVPFDAARVWDFAITSDSRHVVFMASLSDVNVRELYARRSDGSGALVRLDAAPEGHDGVGVRSFVLSPDGTAVVHRADFARRGRFDLWSRPVDASGPQVRLTEAPDGSPGVTDLVVDPTSTTVVYVGETRAVGDRELFVRPLDGSAPAVVLSDIGADGDVFALDVTADGRTVVYDGDLASDGVRELFSRPIDGSGQQRRLTRPQGGDGIVARWQLTPDGRTVVLSASLRSDRSELFTVPVDGSAPASLLGPAGPGDSQVSLFEVAADGSRVAWTRLDAPQRTSLWSAPVGGDDAPVRLDAPAHAASQVVRLHVAPDGARVVFSADLATDGLFSLYSARSDGRGEQVRLDTTSRPGGSTNVFDAVVSPDGTRVVHAGQLGVDDTYHLASRALDGSTPQVLLSETGGTFFGRHATFTPDSATVVYSGREADSEPTRLYAWSRGQLPPPLVAAPVRDAVTADAATVGWAPATASGVQRYEVTLDPATIPAMVVDTATSSVRLEGLEPGTRYVASVVAVNEAGRSAPRTIRFTTALAAAPSTTRLSGRDRDATAAAVATDRFSTTDVATVYLTTGRNFPDALAGGPLAALGDAPILLAGRTGLSAATREALAELAPDRVVALGGTGAVPDAVLADAARAAGTTTTTARLSGPNRYATAAAIATELAPVERVYLATGRNFPDALAASGVTGGAPILLTEPTRLPDDTAAALAALAPDTVVALGGTAAVADEVLARARTVAGATTTARLSGPDRYATATAIADLVEAPRVVYVATGRSFPDALSGAPAAAADGAPLVLVTRDAVPTATATWLRDNDDTVERLVVLGGTGAIAPEVVDQLHALVS